MTAYQRIRRPPLLLPISPRIYIPARVVLRAGRAYSRLPSITLFVVTCCLLACLIAACCLLPAAYLLPRLVPPLPPQSPDPGASTSNRVLTVHVRVLARLAGRGRWYSPVWYLPWMVASVSPYASPSPPAAPASLRHAMLFAIAAYSSALPLLASLLPVCMFELNTPLQLVLLSMSFFHPYIRTPPCNQHLPIADCLVSPSSMYFLALAPLPIRSLAIHCYQLPAGLLATTTLFGCCLQRTMLHHHRLHFASQLAMIRCLHFNSRTTLPVACFTSPSPPAARYASSAACCASSTPSTARLTPPAQLAMLCHRHVQ